MDNEGENVPNTPNNQSAYMEQHLGPPAYAVNVAGYGVPQQNYSQSAPLMPIQPPVVQFQQPQMQMQMQQQQVLYVYAPQGTYPVPGNPTLIAIPQGQAVPQGAPQQQPVFAAPNNVIAPFVIDDRARRYRRHATNLAVAALVTFLVGYFTYLTYLASIIISLHMVRRGYIQKRKVEVITFSVLELVAWAFVAAFGWYYDDACYYYNYGYTSYSYTYYCYTIWWGWISLVVWGTFALAFGIPRVIFTWRHDSK